MWAACIDKLSPIHYQVRTEIPKFLRKAFHDEGMFSDDDIQLPIRRIIALGQCKTALYADCPNMPDHHIQNSRYSDGYLERVGIYYWFDFDIVIIDEMPLQFRMVFNEGSADANDGIWGAVWDRNTQELIANIFSSGDCESTLEVLSSSHIEKFERQDIWIPMDFDRADEQDLLPCEISCAKDLKLEQILTLVIRWCCIYRDEWSYGCLGYDV
jgi:hypothetical protein